MSISESGLDMSNANSKNPEHLSKGKIKEMIRSSKYRGDFSEIARLKRIAEMNGYDI